MKIKNSYKSDVYVRKFAYSYELIYDLLDKSKLSFLLLTVDFCWVSASSSSDSSSSVFFSLRFECVFLTKESFFVRFFIIIGVWEIGDIECFRFVIDRDEFVLLDSSVGWVPDRRGDGVIGSEVNDFLFPERRTAVVGVLVFIWKLNHSNKISYKTKKQCIYFEDESSVWFTGFRRIRGIFDESKILLANNWFLVFVIGIVVLSRLSALGLFRKYFIAFWTDCCRWILFILSFFGKKKFDMPSINCATGRDITVDVSSSLEFLLRNERVVEIFVELFFLVPSLRQFGQAKSPLGMWYKGGSQHFGWIAASQKSQKSN